MIFISLYFLTNRFTGKSLDISESQVAEAGLYGYILPESYVNQTGWQQHIWMSSFPLDCRNNINWRQVRTFYEDNAGNSHFSVVVFPHELRSQNSSAESGLFKLKWVNGLSVEVQSYQAGTWIRIEDKKGIDVEITSDMKLIDILLLITKMQRFGETSSLNLNLWKSNCNVD